MRSDAFIVAFTTDNFERTRTFYSAHFGAKTIFDNGDYLALGFDGLACSQLHFMRAGSASPTGSARAPDGVFISFQVADVDAEHDRLKAAGVSISSELSDQPWGARVFGVTDPNGLSVTIFSPREPSEELKKFFKDHPPC